MKRSAFWLAVALVFLFSLNNAVAESETKNKPEVLDPAPAPNPNSAQPIETEVKRESAIAKGESLTAEDQRILDRGEMSNGRYVISGIIGFYPGFGIGHAIQGRYSERGYIFTIGEVGSVFLMSIGLADCLTSAYPYNGSYSCHSGLVTAGAVGFFGFKIWELIDVWAVPLEQNERYRQLKKRLGDNAIRIEPILYPLADGAVAGMRLSF